MNKSLLGISDDVAAAPSRGQQMLNKVPEVTIFFWIIKVLCTTVGETASDFLNVNLNLGLTGTSIIMGVVLAVALFFQFRARKYIPTLYWLAVVLISIFGTLLTDNLTDNLGIPLETSTAVFSIALALTFIAWYRSEGTLSIHSVFTRRRETFYWLTILFTFALGTASGDLMAESLALGYLVTGLIICATIAVIALAWRFGLDGVLAFWIVYILTRPLGASLGDYLSQTPENGGLGLGASITSVIFLLAILAVVVFLSITKRDLVTSTAAPVAPTEQRRGVIWQVVAVVAVIAVISGTGYTWRRAQLTNEALANSSAAAPLGDLSSFRQITNDTLAMVNAGDLAGAKTRVGDLEVAWDTAQARLKPMNPEQWSVMDQGIDGVLTTLRASPQDPAACRTALESLIAILNTLDKQP